MFKNRLVGEYIDNGRAVLEALRRKKIPITEAFWYDIPERDEWRLIIASPMVYRVGPIEAYTVLQGILNKMGSPLSLSDISFLSPLSPEFRRFREEALGSSRSGKDSANEADHDLTFNDAYLYALPRTVQGR